MIEAHPARTKSGAIAVRVTVNGGDPVVMTPDQADTMTIHTAGEVDSETGRRSLQAAASRARDLNEALGNIRRQGHHECSAARAKVLASAFMDAGVAVGMVRRHYGLAWVVLG